MNAVDRRESEPSRARPASILIVDDVHDTRELYALYFRHKGFTVFTANDGINALDTALSTEPDVIVMDLAMPGLDGITATQKLKKNERTHKTPVVILTGFPMQAIADGAIEAGADVFLTKPCLPEDLEQHVRRLVDAASETTPDVAQLAGLLRRHPQICTACAAAKLAFTLERVLDAVVDLAKTITVEQGQRPCPICERTQWVLSLTS